MKIEKEVVAKKEHGNLTLTFDEIDLKHILADLQEKNKKETLRGRTLDFFRTINEFLNR